MAWVLRLLEIIGRVNSTYQMHPVFVPLRDGKVIECQYIDAGREAFRSLDGTLPHAKRVIAHGAGMLSHEQTCASIPCADNPGIRGMLAYVKVQHQQHETNALLALFFFLPP